MNFLDPFRDYLRRKALRGSTDPGKVLDQVCRDTADMRRHDLRELDASLRRTQRELWGLVSREADQSHD